MYEFIFNKTFKFNNYNKNKVLIVQKNLNSMKHDKTQ